MASRDEFQTAPGAVGGFECGDSSKNWDIPAFCQPGSQLNVRYQSPSCWDGVNLQPATTGHMATSDHMAYPVEGACPDSHPVAVPMIEFKMAFPASGDMTGLAFASINGGPQCDPRGYDQYKPHCGAVLDTNYVLP